VAFFEPQLFLYQKREDCICITNFGAWTRVWRRHSSWL